MRFLIVERGTRKAEMHLRRLVSEIDLTDDQLDQIIALQPDQSLVLGGFVEPLSVTRIDGIPQIRVRYRPLLGSMRTSFYCRVLPDSEWTAIGTLLIPMDQWEAVALLLKSTAVEFGPYESPD